MLRCEAWQKYSDPPAWTKQYQITPGEFSAPLSPAACAPESFQDVSLDWRTRGVMWIKGQRGVKLGTPTWPLQGHEWSTNCPAPPLIIWEHGSSILNEHHRSRPHRIKTLDWSGIWVECLDDISVVISRITDAAPCLEVRVTRHMIRWSHPSLPATGVWPWPHTGTECDPHQDFITGSNSFRVPPIGSGLSRGLVME